MPSTKHIDIQGHRGARGLFPENTLTAFIEAVKLGVHTLEMDVVISKDHKVVVSHEPWMNELFCSAPNGQPIENGSKEKYNLYKMLYADIAKFDCGKRGNPEFPLQKAVPEHKPLLSEVFEKVDAFTKANNLPLVKYNIEIKSDPTEDNIYNPIPKVFTELVLTVLKNKNVLSRTILQSFDVRILQELKKKDPSLTLSFLVENKDSLEHNLHKLGFIPDIYAPEFILINEQLIKDLRSKNIKLITWTVNEIEDIKKMVSLGVDGIISDHPDIVINLLNK